jgi:tRNA(Arg) A34 adenosine deaminase TadA
MDDTPQQTRMRQALALAGEAADRGDEPFGTVLVRDEAVVMSASNRIHTADDIRRHPELHLAYRACREFDSAARAETVMYTSTEPCPMCAGGLVSAAFERVVYSVSGPDLAEFTGSEPPVRSAEILDGVTEVTGPVLPEEGRAVHEAFDW